MKLLFLHGTGSKPGDVRASYLVEHGHDVLNPALPDDDFDEAVRIAQQEYDQGKLDVIVGSSRGGAVAMNIESGDTPLVLLCPAWKRYGTATTTKPNTTILHSKTDERVPFAESEELVKNSGLPTSVLIAVGTQHRLVDAESLRKMLEAVEKVVPGIPDRRELPISIERLLTRLSFSCGEPEYTKFRQELLRDQVMDSADANDNGRSQLHDACIEHLADPDSIVVRNAVSCLFVIGTSADVPAIEPLLHHSSDAVRRATRSCLFEIRRRPQEAGPT